MIITLGEEDYLYLWWWSGGCIAIDDIPVLVNKEFCKIPLDGVSQNAASLLRLQELVNGRLLRTINVHLQGQQYASQSHTPRIQSRRVQASVKLGVCGSEKWGCYLVKNGELGFEPCASELLDLCIWTGLLTSKLIAGESQNLKICTSQKHSVGSNSADKF